MTDPLRLASSAAPPATTTVDHLLALKGGRQSNSMAHPPVRVSVVACAILDVSCLLHSDAADSPYRGHPAGGDV